MKASDESSGHSAGRPAQRNHTRKAIVQAAGRLLARGEMPSLDQIAEEAEVSRATAYRYFPGLDALLGEAAVDALMPEPEDVFGTGAPADPVARVLLVDDVFDLACREREIPLRLMLARILERSTQRPAGDQPLRQNRRVPMLRQALAPPGDRLGSRERERLVHAFAILVGTESMIALKDVVGLDAAEARDVRHWAIKALLAAPLQD